MEPHISADRLVYWTYFVPKHVGVGNLRGAGLAADGLVWRMPRGLVGVGRVFFVRELSGIFQKKNH